MNAIGTGGSSAPQPLTLDFTSVAPDSGGVGVVAKGVAAGLASVDVQFRCVVNSSNYDKWLVSLPELTTLFEPVEVRLNASSSWQQALRKILPRGGLLTQSAVSWARSIRANSTRTALGEGVVWHPFHRVPVAGNSSVVTVHDLRVFEPELASPMDQKIIERNVHEAGAVVCSWAHPYLSLIERFPAAREKTFLVPLPVLNPGPWQTHTRPPHKARLLLPGFVTPHKNHEVVVRALAKMPEAQVVFTGSEDGSYGNWLRELAASLGVAERIEWLGFVDEARLEAEYERADMLVMPTRWEAASGPVFEAIIRGLPFVASRIDPIVSQLSILGLKAETFAWDDPNELCAAVSRTLSRYDNAVSDLEPLSRELRARDWAQVAGEYNRVFEWVNGTGEKPLDLMRGEII